MADQENSLFAPPVKPDRESASKKKSPRPLADRMRPRSIDEVVGQDHLLGTGKFLYEAILSDEIPSMIFWGPPGVGKTTIANLIAEKTNAYFVSLSAVMSGVREVKKVLEEAEYQLSFKNRRTILFVDEIHRFNKAQQDAFLPNVENGTIILIGATTENPSFEVISPLLSRSRVLVLNSLGEQDLEELLKRALSDPVNGLGNWNLGIDTEVIHEISRFANGDARIALNSLDAAAHFARRKNPNDPSLSIGDLETVLQKRALLYDKSGEEHFNLISALHKSLRNSDVDASLYWLGRMLEAGEDPLYIARRLVRFASEDVGLADPRALRVALDAKQAFHFIGLPEGKLALAQAAIYLAAAPKSNALYTAYKRVEEAIQKSRNEPVPMHIRNAPTGLMKHLGYGQGYRYAHSEEDGVSLMDCLPDNLKNSRFYEPSERGHEKKVKQILSDIQKIRDKKR
jgi:putative ATPase